MPSTNTKKTAWCVGLLVLAGTLSLNCASLPKDRTAAQYYQLWQEAEKDLAQCEADAQHCKETIHKVLPFVNE